MDYDVIVIGGGPAGMMTAGRAGELGAKVLLLEKNNEVGIKLLLTGKGRCNLTNLCEVSEFIEKFGKNGKFLFSTLTKFSPQKTIDFFNQQNLKTKIEENNRVFPVSDKSLDVRQALLNYLQKSKVEILKKAIVKEIVLKNKLIEKIVLNDGRIFTAKKYILATGGKSYPTTGSTGDGLNWLEKLGHTLIPPKPALTSIILKEKFIADLEGLSLKTEISLWQNGKKIVQDFGEFIFTSDGMSGPVILNLSKKIGESLEKGKTEISIDFFPNLSSQELNLKLQKIFQENNNKNFKNVLEDILPKKLVPVLVKLSKIEENKKVNLISKLERLNLVQLLKNFSLEIVGLKGFERAMITAGGVKLAEVDSKTMQSKIVKNLYFAGEILDLDGPTGGYNLQVCWSTGFVAGGCAGKI